jgi:hypothetical protein
MLLKERGEPEASRRLDSLQVRECWRGGSDNYTLGPIPRDGRALIFGDPDRKPVRLLQPSAVPRRSWQVGVQLICGETMEIDLVRPSVLRPTLRRLGRTVDRLGAHPPV